MRVPNEVTTVVALALAGCAQSPELDTQTFRLEHLDGGAAARIVDPYVYGDRPGAPGTLSHEGYVLTVRETPDNLEKIARVLDEFDRPTPSIQLKFQIIEADGVTRSDTAIAEVEEALRKLFQFRGYRLLAQAYAGGVEGSEVTQTVRTGSDSYTIRARIHRVRATDTSGTVELSVGLHSGSGGLESTVNVPVGKTVVLGNAQLDPKRGPLILAVRPELARQ